MSAGCRGCGQPVAHGVACSVCAARFALTGSYAETPALRAVDDDGQTRSPFELVDLAEHIRQGYQPPRYRVENVVADGTLTVVAAESGVGKSAFAQALCDGVALGIPVAGLHCERGVALYVDAEMGPEMFANRACLFGARESLRYLYADAGGVDLMRNCGAAALSELISDNAARFVVLDSLRALAPSAEENSNDAMAPVMRGLLAVARTTGAALVLIHHRGKGDMSFRGATAIRDQCDALFTLAKSEDGTVTMSCRNGGKFRYDREPRPLHFLLDFEAGGIVATDAPEPSTRNAPSRTSAQTEALSVLWDAEEPLSQADICRRLGRSKADGTVRRALLALADQGDAEQTPQGWVATSVATLAGNVATPLPCGHDAAWRASPSRAWTCGVCHPPAATNVEWRASA